MEWDIYKGSNNEEHVHHAEEDGTYATQTGVHMDRCHCVAKLSSCHSQKMRDETGHIVQMQIYVY